MVTITNIHNLPLAIVKAVQNDDYDRGHSDITITELISPPRMVALKHAHKDELTEDASDRIWALLGQVMHSILERAGEGALTEERLYTERLGWQIGGRFDAVTVAPFSVDHVVANIADLNKWLLIDWKFTSVWAIKERVKPEWEAQLNLLALLLREAGFPIVQAQVGALLRDWSKPEAARSPGDYPQSQVQMIEARLWPPEEAEAYLLQRVRLHQAARQALPDCTSEERWERPSVWAVMQKGRERAAKLFAVRDEATVWMKAQKNWLDMSLVFRAGESQRCTHYCAALPFCNQGMALVVEKKE